MQDSLAALDKQHEDAQAALELAQKVTKDAEYEQYLEYSVHDLQEQLNASETALQLAQNDDLSYLGKLVPGQQEGELGALFMAEDPLLLNSIRRGDFVKGFPNETELIPYTDHGGHPISAEEMKKLADETETELIQEGEQARDQFDALPLIDSHMMHDDRKHRFNKGKPDEDGNLDAPVYTPLKRLDRLCLLCESLAGSGELASVAPCAGLSCSLAPRIRVLRTYADVC